MIVEVMSVQNNMRLGKPSKITKKKNKKKKEHYENLEKERKYTMSGASL